MNISDLIKHCDSIKRLTNICKPNNKWYPYYLKLLELTDFLPENTSSRERLYYVKNNLSSPVKCHTCDNMSYWNERGDNIYTYNKYCSKCAKKSPEYRENYKNAMLDNYGVEHNWQSGELRDRDLKNSILKFGNKEEIENSDNITSIFQLESIKNKSKEKLLDKYGVEHNWQSGELRDKDLRDLIYRYGTDIEIENIDNIKSFIELEYFKQKSKESLLEKYGVDNIFKDKHCRSTSLNKIILKYGTFEEIENIDNIKSFVELEYFKETSTMSKIARYGNCNYVNPDKIKETHVKKSYPMIESYLSNNGFKLLSNIEYYIKNKLIKYICKKCGTKNESRWPYIRCTTCYPYNKSIAEQEIYDYCSSLTDSMVLSNDRQIIKPMELDIVIPNYNLAIEYNGLFWHSSDSVETESSDYHLSKTLQCKDQGIQLLHIFENEWANPIKQNIWKSIIRNKLGYSNKIYARKCVIRVVSNIDKSEFLINNHLQGDCSSSVNIGLEYDGELVSLMTFGKSRFSKKYDWELLRFCNKLDTVIIGGASKLLKYFRLENSGSIISYADIRRSNGNLYKQLGFELSHESKPNYWYFKNLNFGLESRIKYQKHKLKNKLDLFNPVLTESENMYNNGYRKIYDCGNQVWILK